MGSNLADGLETVGAAGMRQSVALCIFAVGTVTLSWRYPTTASLERPVVLSAISLLWTGLCLLLYIQRQTGEQYSATLYLQRNAHAQSRTRSELLKDLVVPVALVARAFLFRHTLWWAQCSQEGLSFLLPALLSVASWAWPHHQHEHTPLATYAQPPTSSQGLWSHLKIVNEQQRAVKKRFPTRHVALAITWAFLADQLLATTVGTTGLVCPTGSTLWPAAGIAQLVVLGLDASALFLLGRRRSKSHQPDEKLALEMSGGRRLAGNCILAAASMLLLLVATAPFATTSLREIAVASSLRGLVARDLLLDSVLAAGVLLSGMYLLAYLTPTTLALVGSTAFISVHPAFQPITGAGLEPSTPIGAILLGISAITSLALLSHDTIRLDTDLSRLPTPSKPPHKKRLTTLLTALTLLLATTTTTHTLLTPRQDPLPIIRTAQAASTTWLTTAAASSSEQTAHAATQAYKARYAGLPPPPKFAQWLAFARARNAPVLDVYDQVHADLAPFWGLSPAELRGRTALLLTQPGIGGIRIRRGAMEVVGVGLGGGEDVDDVEEEEHHHHHQMMAAWRDMIAPFAAALPDMNIAFNLLDGAPHVAVPHEVLTGLLAEGRKAMRALAASRAEGHPLRGWFSKSGASAWENNSTSRVFSNEKLKPTSLGVYDTWIAPTCAPVRRARLWDGGRAAVASSALLPPDLCARPDLARLHEFLLLAPRLGGLAVTQRAMPVFGSSRVDGFNDILVPSPWDFVAAKRGVVVSNGTRDMGTWMEKTDAVFWRGEREVGGAAVEGSEWPGFVGARLVNLASNKGAFASHARDGPAVDISFAEDVTRCEGSECGGGRASTSRGDDGPASASYRHLIDIDGAGGASGRFLPLLRTSNSTVYRATLFRAWYDERVHPWKHYVPVDVSLRGLWDVVWLVSRKFLVQFADSSKPLAEQIATDGHDWAAKALRKEDMQVYMFRLLLEWARLVDDDREELGYDP